MNCLEGEPNNLNDNEHSNNICSIMKNNFKAITQYLKWNIPFVRSWWPSANSGTPMKYSPWTNGQPNNANGDEDCVHMWQYRGKDLNKFICELKTPTAFSAKVPTSITNLTGMLVKSCYISAKEE
uniref:C-type lectin domain-containing protein n=1 Tax=Glossina palpalis gambiensis TaxID=67801 RepID=A0A1B0BGQ1_9MUSC